MRNIVKYLRRSQEFDLTQQELAKAIGTTKSTISAIENGAANPSSALMLRLAIFFNRDPREIFFVDDVIQQITEGGSDDVFSRIPHSVGK